MMEGKEALEEKAQTCRTMALATRIVLKGIEDNIEEDEIFKGQWWIHVGEYITVSMTTKMIHVDHPEYEDLALKLKEGYWREVEEVFGIEKHYEE